MKEIEEISEQIRADFEYETNAKYQGLFKSLGLMIATRFYQFLDKLNFIKKQAFVNTADEEYLLLHSGGILERRGETYAKGTVVFYGEDGYTVAEGTIVKDDKAEYITKHEVLIRNTNFTGIAQVTDFLVTVELANNSLTNCNGIVNGIGKNITVVDNDTIQFDSQGIHNGETLNISIKKSDEIEVVAVKSGVDGNREKSDKLSLIDTIEGIDNDLYAFGISGGAEAEDIKAYRGRVNSMLYLPQAPFNRNNISFVIMESRQNIVAVWTKTKQSGEVAIYIADENGNATAYDIEVSKSAVIEILPPQMHDTQVAVAEPSKVTVDINIENLVPNNDEIKTEIEKNLKYIFGIRSFEKRLTKELIEGTIYKTESDTQEVDSFTTDFTTHDAVNDTIHILGQVTYS